MRAFLFLNTLFLFDMIHTDPYLLRNMMAVILQVDFPSSGPFGEQMAQMMQPLAQSINEEKGMLWKIWTENAKTQEAGGIYLFENQELAEQYLAMHSARLESFGFKNIRSKILNYNAELSHLNKAIFLE